jgi:hypothetical protein
VFDFRKPIRRHHGAGLQVKLAAPRARVPFEHKTEAAPRGSEHLDTLRDDLCADTVPGNQCYFILLDDAPLATLGLAAPFAPNTRAPIAGAA